MKTSDIISKIYSDFALTYKGATNFVNSGELWDFCIDTIKNPTALSCIVFANDMGVPPVKSLVEMYRRKRALPDSFEFNERQSVCMGSLMGFVFKFVLNYQSQNERCTVKLLGVKTAARFTSCPFRELEFTE